jgi:hypothetical protein
MGKRKGEVREGGFNFNYYFDIPLETNPICFPNSALR